MDVVKTWYLTEKRADLQKGGGMVEEIIMVCAMISVAIEIAKYSRA